MLQCAKQRVTQLFGVWHSLYLTDFVSVDILRINNIRKTQTDYLQVQDVIFNNIFLRNMICIFCLLKINLNVKVPT